MKMADTKREQLYRKTISDRTLKPLIAATALALTEKMLVHKDPHSKIRDSSIDKGALYLDQI